MLDQPHADGQTLPGQAAGGGAGGVRGAEAGLGLNRALATRYDKRASYYRAMVTLARFRLRLRLWLNDFPDTR
ncbi:hypothetical protein [Streptomyces sp. NPDC047097]|uniref:hypothetical protein n=1 Tax=Streptomyces sp. NPDC047097 TaxID=3155260 RepID=UPI0033EF6195